MISLESNNKIKNVAIYNNTNTKLIKKTLGT